MKRVADPPIYSDNAAESQAALATSADSFGINFGL
jgi:hypothetical protein